jgi:hypothetical protein
MTIVGDDLPNVMVERDRRARRFVLKIADAIRFRACRGPARHAG